MNKTIVSASILASDFKNLAEEIKKVQKAGAEWLHFDVMDGDFVPNISFGIPVLKSLAGHFDIYNDVHIMISKPLEYAKRFVEAGADLLTFHYEACKNDQEVKQIIDLIHQSGAKVGLSIKPKTNVEKVYPFLDSLDLVLIMTVEPGFGGQAFIESCVSKIEALRKEIDAKHYQTLIEVDGGINDQSGQICKNAGADVLVSGSYLFGHKDIKKRVNSLLIKR